MRSGEILQIHITPVEGRPAQAVPEVRAHKGKGLEGDHRWAGAVETGTPLGPGREVTLIEIEAIEGLARETGIRITAADTKRNLLTRGVALNHLVEREFRVGDVVLRGERLCEPCATLERSTQKGVLTGLLHRGGLRASIVEEGVVRIGDEVEERP